MDYEALDQVKRRIEVLLLTHGVECEGQYDHGITTIKVKAWRGGAPVITRVLQGFIRPDEVKALTDELVAYWTKTNIDLGMQRLVNVT